MIKRLLFVLMIALSFSCNDNLMDEANLNESDLSLKKAKLEKKDKTKKKGIGLSMKNDQWSSMVSKLKVEWHYSWGFYFTPKEPELVQYVPMDWGGSISKDALIDYLIQKKNTGEARYVLGFNEPDGEKQANMTVEEALDLWPRLEEVGLPLGSPATVNPENDWMQSFMAEVENRGLRVDFICVHHYGGISAEGFLNKLERVYELYQRPIWITEFAVADWNAQTPEENRYSPEQVLTFMETVLPELEKRKYIQRYAWFPAKQDRAPLTSSALFDAAGNLTVLGEYYAKFKHNMRIGAGKDDLIVVDDPDNLVLNGNFETGDLSYWGGYNSKFAGVVTTQPHGGEFLAQINNKEGALVQEIQTPLVPGQTYTVSIWNKWKTTPPGKVKVVVKDMATNSKLLAFDISSSTDWKQSVGEFICPPNVENIKIVIWKPAKQNKIVTPELFVDDVVVKVVN